MTGLLLHINYELFMRVYTDGFPELLILAQQELLRQTPDGGMEWPYISDGMRRRRPWPWRRTRPSSLQNQKALIAHLQALQTSIAGPGVLLRFHSIRKLVESHQFPVILGDHRATRSTTPGVLASSLRALFQRQRATVAHENQAGEDGRPAVGARAGRALPSPGASNGRRKRPLRKPPQPEPGKPIPRGDEAFHGVWGRQINSSPNGGQCDGFRENIGESLLQADASRLLTKSR